MQRDASARFLSPIFMDPSATTGVLDFDLMDRTGILSLASTNPGLGTRALASIDWGTDTGDSRTGIVVSDFGLDRHWVRHGY